MAWIKFDKSLIGDPRILRATSILHDDLTVTRDARSIGPSSVDDESYNVLRNAVTGALCALWVYADTHIRDGDILPISAYDIDRMVGIDGFCHAVGPDWVQLTPEQNHVILPGYIDKNSLVSKGIRANRSAERQRKFRENQKAQAKTPRNAKRNAVTNRAVTAGDLDQDLDHKEKKEPLRAPDGLDMKAWGEWLAYRKSAKPLKPVSYAAAMKAMVKLGANQMACVQQSIANGWTGLFELKTGPRNAALGRPSNVPTDSEWQDLFHRAEKIGFRPAADGESAPAYHTLLSRAEMERRNRGGSPERVLPTFARQGT